MELAIHMRRGSGKTFGVSRKYKMTKLTFENQMKRLATIWGQNNYHPEVIAILWRAFQNAFDEHFIAAIDQIIANHPARHKPPLLDHLDKALEEAKIRANAPRIEGNAFANVLSTAASSEQASADPELVQACIRTFNEYVLGRISREQFLSACDALDNLAGHISRGKKWTAPSGKVLALKDN